MVEDIHYKSKTSNTDLFSHVPPVIQNCYIESGGCFGQLKLVLATDLAASGVFGEQWLLVDECAVSRIVAMSFCEPRS